MIRLLRFSSRLAAGLLLCWAAGLAPVSTVRADGLLSPADADRLGMTESWRRQLSLVGGARSAVDIKLHVDTSRMRRFVEVRHEKDGETEVLDRIDVEQRDRFGTPIGLQEARRRAKLQVFRWKRRGIEATISENQVPQIRLYTLGSDGTIEARDAETGELYWLTRQGDPTQLSIGLGVSDQYLCYVNGSTLYQISTETGKVVRETRTTGTPTLGTLIAGDYALMPTVRGGVEGFPLYDSNEYPFMEMVAGRATATPTQAPGTARAAWPTDAGFVYVMEAEGTPSVIFRFNTDGVVSSPLSAGEGERLFFGSENGHVYGIRATRSGTVLWRHSLGEPVYAGTFVSDKQLFVPTVYKNLYCLEVATGAAMWKSPATGIDAVLGSSSDRIYARTNSNRLAILDAQSGGRIADIAGVDVERYVVNRLTDRLYLVGNGGMLQCLRPVDSPLPLLKVTAEPPAAATDTPEEQPAQRPDQDPFEAGGDAPDPFAPAGGGMDPFAPADDAVDPFAPADDAADPFAPADGQDDPFAPGGGF